MTIRDNCLLKNKSPWKGTKTSIRLIREKLEWTDKQWVILVEVKQSHLAKVNWTLSEPCREWKSTKNEEEKTNKDRNQIWTYSLGSGWARHGQARLKSKTRDPGGCAHCLVWFLNPVFQSQMVLICGRQFFQGFPIPTVQASAVPSFSSARSQTLKVIINKELARLSLSPNNRCNQMNVERSNSGEQLH